MLKLKTILQSNIFIISIIIVTLAYCLFYNFGIQHTSKYHSSNNNFTVKIINYNINGNLLTLHLLGKEKLVAYYTIKTKEEKDYLTNNLVLGSKIKLKGTLSHPLNNTIPNTFNYRKYLYYEHIYYILNIEKYELNSQCSIIYKIQNYITRKLNESPNQAYLNTFILGDKSYLDKEVYANYQSNGVSHLFAISGMHIALLSTTFLKLLKKFKHREIVNLFFLWFYVFFIGFLPSVLRAITFFTILYINKVLRLNLSTIKCLLLSGCIILLIDPFMFFKLGFQFSFIVTLGLLLSSSKIKSHHYLGNIFQVSFWALLFSLPLTIYNFYEFNLFGLIANLIFVPLITYIYYPLSIITLIIPIFNSIYSSLINILESLNQFIANINFAKIIIAKINWLDMLIYYICLYLLIKRNIKFIVILLGVIIFWKIRINFDNNYYVYYLDVGQGDSSLLVSPKRKESMLIDTGGSINYSSEKWQLKNQQNSTANNLILFFKSIGLSTINYLIISHGDQDHIGNSLDMVRKFSFKNLILNNNKLTNLESQLKKLMKKSTNQIDLKYFTVQNLNTKIYDNENDNSLVYWIAIKHINLLYMGDASQKVEKDILKMDKLDIDKLNINILKIGHHGSKSSSSIELLQTVKPNYAVISSGRNNRFHHPHQEVLTKLKQEQITTFNTQDKGTIVFKIREKVETIKFYYP